MSGMSVYTCRLANSLAETADVSVILLEHLIPKRFYPGGSRVGEQLEMLRFDEKVQIAGNVDWWGRGLLGSLRSLRRDRANALVLQWWTAATLHTFLVLALVGRMLRIPVVIEFHEIQDTGEARVPFVDLYARFLVPVLIRLASAGVVHHEHDRQALEARYGKRAMGRLTLATAPHGPYDHYAAAGPAPTSRRGGESVTRVLSFGTIRPYKGVEDLIAGYSRLNREAAETLALSVVGETWEGWTLPGELIEASPHRDLITFVNHYVTDEEAAAYLGDADVVVLPARRGSASGPLQMAMSAGVHVVMYAVPGLMAAAEDYDGLVAIPEGDSDALVQALLDIGDRRGQRFKDPHSWDRTVAAYADLVSTLK